jgi:putative membrane protein
VVGGVQVSGFGAALIGALILGFVNAFVRPVMILLTLPLTIVTLGLFLFVLNAFMLWLVAALVPGFQISGFGAALLGSLLLTVLNILIDRLASKD